MPHHPFPPLIINYTYRTSTTNFLFSSVVKYLKEAHATGRSNPVNLGQALAMLGKKRSEAVSIFANAFKLQGQNEFTARRMAELEVRKQFDAYLAGRQRRESRPGARTA